MINKNKVFKSRFFLDFANDTYEEEYTEYTYIGITSKNLVCTIVFGILAIINIIQLTHNDYVKDNLPYFIYISYSLLGINFISFICLIIFIKRRIVHEVVSTANYLIDGFYFHIFMGVFSNTRIIESGLYDHEYNILMPAILTTLLNVSKIGLAMLVLKGFRRKLLTISAGFICDIVFIVLTFQTYNKGLYCYIIANFMIWLGLAIGDFFIEIKNRSFYFTFNEMRRVLSDYRSMVYNSKNPYFAYSSKDNSIQYLNRSIHNLSHFFEKHIDHGTAASINNSIFKRTSTKSLFQNNVRTQDYFSYYKVLKENIINIHQNDIEIKDNDMGFRFSDDLFNQLVYINEELPNELYDYLMGVRSKKESFILNKFSKMAVKCFGQDALSSDIYFNNDIITPELIHEFKSVNNTGINTNNNTQVPILSMKKNSIGSRKNLIKHKTLASVKNKVSEYIFLGKSRVKFDKVKENIFYKEYFIYFDVVNDNINFIIEDYNSLLLKERKETVQTCRKLYLSKISHEFKNPVCNILEVLSLLYDDLAGEMGRLDSLRQNLSILKNICEIMSLLIKDFSFYSKLMIEEENETLATNQNNEDKLGNIETLIQSPQFKSSLLGKTFNYKTHIEDMIELLSNKAKVDKRDSKIKFDYETETEDLDCIECDKNLFDSLLFNIFFHCYKSIGSGSVKLSVSKLESENKTNFEIIAKGLMSMNNKTGSAFNKIEKFINSSYESNDFSTISDKLEDDQSNSYIAENYHIKNLFSIIDANQRNNIIDEFNNNFNIYISQHYAKRIGSRLNIQILNREKLLISFSVNNAIPRLSTKNIIVPQVHVKKVEPRKSANIFYPSYTIETFGKSNTGCFADIASEKDCSNTVNNDEVYSTKTIQVDYSLNYNYSQMEKVLITSFCYQPVSILGQSEGRRPSKTIPFYRFDPGNNLSPIINRNARRISNTIIANKDIMYMNIENKIAHNFIKFDSYSKRSKRSSALLLSNEKMATFKPNLRVLLVDDEMLIRKCLIRYFNKISDMNNMVFDVCEAENGFECMEQIYKYYQENKLFDVIFIDETMPIVRGTIVIEMLKNIILDGKLDDIIIVSYTSYDSPEKKEHIFSKGADYIITKPIRYDDFVVFIENIIEKKK
jgi:CheY-like chemotaxis protein